MPECAEAYCAVSVDAEGQKCEGCRKARKAPRAANKEALRGL